MQRRILITGAAGKTAKVVAEILAGHGFFVRALVRKENDRSKRLADRGAEIVTGDMLSLADMKVATHGMDSADFCYPTSDRILEASAIMTEAARENEMGYRSNSVRALRNSIAGPVTKRDDQRV